MVKLTYWLTPSSTDDDMIWSLDGCRLDHLVLVLVLLVVVLVPIPMYIMYHCFGPQVVLVLRSTGTSSTDTYYYWPSALSQLLDGWARKRQFDGFGYVLWLEVLTFPCDVPSARERLQILIKNSK
jgi:hypothetical protein